MILIHNLKNKLLTEIPTNYYAINQDKLIKDYLLSFFFNYKWWSIGLPVVSSWNYIE